jgi:hypothetical protein
VQDYEDGMRACYDAAKTWMAVSFPSLFFLWVGLNDPSNLLA